MTANHKGGEKRPKALMIAFNYPPGRGSSGLHRVTSFTRYLARAGWDPVVLTVSPCAHAELSDAPSEDSESGIRVRRAWALDSARHLAFRGKYIGWTALPDRWVSWFPTGVITGAVECLRSKPDIIWSTFPIATAHLIGLALHRLTGVPWVADFRDPMLQDASVQDPARRGPYGAIERAAIKHAHALVFVSNSARDSCMARYPERDPASFHVIENGYDERSFEAAERLLASSGTPRARVKLLHSGVIYLGGRNPFPLLDAVAALRDRTPERAAALELVFRASAVEKELRAAIAQRSLESIVSVEPALDYAPALREMLESDALLLLQGSAFNRQIPAKAYEYLRAGRPILALTDAAGETARLLRDFPATWIAPIEDATAIGAALEGLLNATRPGAPRVMRAGVDAFSREGQARRLAELFGSLTAPTCVRRPA